MFLINKAEILGILVYFSYDFFVPSEWTSIDYCKSNLHTVKGLQVILILSSTSSEHATLYHHIFSGIVIPINATRGSWAQEQKYLQSQLSV